ncbi:hypothetical protein EYC84_007189 [Monilinia fructicola]|uniref:Uncharacterized protein n=1 Tax=Monilinia fructicola TaxID=38448 RepID=A0A5M9KDZ6_MONFR|nr:hypothetical protein EYC84_007189 [Monilinia fructicola]
MPRFTSSFFKAHPLAKMQTVSPCRMRIRRTCDHFSCVSFMHFIHSFHVPTPSYYNPQRLMIPKSHAHA